MAFQSEGKKIQHKTFYMASRKHGEVKRLIVVEGVNRCLAIGPPQPFGKNSNGAG